MDEEIERFKKFTGFNDFSEKEKCMLIDRVKKQYLIMNCMAHGVSPVLMYLTKKIFGVYYSFTEEQHYKMDKYFGSIYFPNVKYDLESYLKDEKHMKEIKHKIVEKK